MTSSLLNFMQSPSFERQLHKTLRFCLHGYYSTVVYLFLLEQAELIAYIVARNPGNKLVLKTGYLSNYEIRFQIIYARTPARTFMAKLMSFLLMQPPPFKATA